MVELKTKTITSKKSGKQFEAYYFAIGDFESPIFFPSKIEIQYIEEHLND